MILPTNQSAMDDKREKLKIKKTTIELINLIYLPILKVKKCLLKNICSLQGRKLLYTRTSNYQRICCYNATLVYMSFSVTLMNLEIEGHPSMWLFLLCCMSLSKLPKNPCVEPPLKPIDIKTKRRHLNLE
jgi:hypothetical protein